MPKGLGSLVAALLAAAGLLCLSGPASAQPPTNDDCAAATVVATMPYSDLIDTRTATTALSDPSQSCDSPGVNSKSVWYSFTPSANGSLDVDTQGSSYDTIVTVSSGTCNALSEQACSDDAYSLPGPSFVSLSLTGGTTYLIEVTAYGTAGKGGLLRVAMGFYASVANDNCASAAVVTAVPFAATLETAGATTAADDPTVCNSTRNSNSVWYSYTTITDQVVEVSTAGSGYDTVLAIHQGTCGALTAVPNACNDDTAPGLSSFVRFTATAGTPYLIEVMDYGGPNGGTLSFSLNPLTCGNHQMDPGEECDDGNLDPCDGCSPTCQEDDPGYVCGDGTFNAACEQCDDGNTEGSDGCTATCVFEPKARRCQGAIAAASRLYVFRSLKALQRCRSLRDKGALAVTDCLTEAKTSGAIAAAQTRVRQLIAAKCTDTILPILGACASRVDDLVTPAADGGCIIAGHRSRVNAMITDEYGQ